MFNVTRNRNQKDGQSSRGLINYYRLYYSAVQGPAVRYSQEEKALISCICSAKQNTVGVLFDIFLNLIFLLF